MFNSNITNFLRFFILTIQIILLFTVGVPRLTISKEDIDSYVSQALTSNFIKGMNCYSDPSGIICTHSSRDKHVKFSDTKLEINHEKYDINSSLFKNFHHSTMVEQYGVTKNVQCGKSKLTFNLMTANTVPMYGYFDNSRTDCFNKIRSSDKCKKDLVDNSILPLTEVPITVEFSGIREFIKESVDCEELQDVYIKSDFHQWSIGWPKDQNCDSGDYREHFSFTRSSDSSWEPNYNVKVAICYKRKIMKCIRYRPKSLTTSIKLVSTPNVSIIDEKCCFEKLNSFDPGFKIVSYGGGFADISSYGVYEVPGRNFYFPSNGNSEEAINDVIFNPQGNMQYTRLYNFIWDWDAKSEKAWLKAIWNKDKFQVVNNECYVNANFNFVTNYYSDYSTNIDFNVKFTLKRFSGDICSIQFSNESHETNYYYSVDMLTWNEIVVDDDRHTFSCGRTLYFPGKLKLMNGYLTGVNESHVINEDFYISVVTLSGQEDEIFVKDTFINEDSTAVGGEYSVNFTGLNNLARNITITICSIIGLIVMVILACLIAKCSIRKKVVQSTVDDKPLDADNRTLSFASNNTYQDESLTEFKYT